jgi:hypothetical protein
MRFSLNDQTNPPQEDTPRLLFLTTYCTLSLPRGDLGVSILIRPSEYADELMTQIKYNSLDRSRIQQLPNEVHRKEPEQGSAIAKGLAVQGMAEQCMLVKMVRRSQWARTVLPSQLCCGEAQGTQGVPVIIPSSTVHLSINALRRQAQHRHVTITDSTNDCLH